MRSAPDFNRPQSFLFESKIIEGRRSKGTESYYPLKGKEPLKDRRVKKISIRRAGGEFSSFDEIRKEVEQYLPILNQYLAGYIPKYQIFYEGQGEKEPDSIQPYMVMEEVQKTQVENENDRVNFFKSLDDYHSEALEMYIQTGLYPDFGNYMYGTTKSSPDKPQIYYYDLYPIAAHMGPTPERLLEIQLAVLKNSVTEDGGCDFDIKDFPKIVAKRKAIQIIKGSRLAKI